MSTVLCSIACESEVWKQSRHSSAGNMWLNKWWYVQTRAYCAAAETNEETFCIWHGKISKVHNYMKKSKIHREQCKYYAIFVQKEISVCVWIYIIFQERHLRRSTGCLLVEELSNWKLSMRGTLFTVGPSLLKFMKILPIWKETLIDTCHSK